jgi:hypothetical protein
MFDPGEERAEAVYRFAIGVLLRRSGDPQGVDMIKNGFVVPGHVVLLLYRMLRLY